MSKTAEKSPTLAGDKKKEMEKEKLKAAMMKKLPVSKVVVHPLVLLSVTDHYYRVNKTETVNRVAGVLLGSFRENDVVDVSNSFAVPFDESGQNVWFLDRDYLENMYAMFKKVNAREKIVGWYHTGPKLNPNDIDINEVVKQYAPKSILLVVDVRPKDHKLPTDAYLEVEEVHDDGTPTTRTFEHVLSEMGAEEAEEVGVEHLLRDIKDQTAGTLSQKVTDKFFAVQGLQNNLKQVREYLKRVDDGKLPINHPINYLAQDLLNLLPNTMAPTFAKSTNTQMNDEMLIIYSGSLARSIVALDNLINNKISLREAEKSVENKELTKKGDDTSKDASIKTTGKK